MRHFINLVDKLLLEEARKQPFKQPLREFVNDGSNLDLNTVVSYLSYYLGQDLYRVGGPNRVYEIDGGGRGAIYVIGQSNAAIGLSWQNRAIRNIYVWTHFSLLRPAEFCFDIPKVDFDLLAPTMANLIRKPRVGKIEVNLNESKVYEGAKRRTSETEFVNMIRQWAAKHNKDITKIAYRPDLMDVSNEFGVQVPGDVLHNKKWKSTRYPGVFNFSADGTDSSEDEEDRNVNKTISNIIGADIQSTVPDDEGEPDETWDTALNLAKAKQLRKLVAEKKIIITGRKNGKFFSIPKDLFDGILAMVERMLAQQMQDTAGEEGKSSMEVQYEDLIEKVKHIASGKSTYIKALLVTGAPSSGKSFTIMQVIKELGLQKGKDYVYKKGNATPASVYRILIEQCNGGLAVFDDCDSVTATESGLNMLKGALDTDKVRQVDYDMKRGVVNTAVLSEEERDAYVSRLSELLRGRAPTIEDAEFYKKFVPLKALKQSKAEQQRDAKIAAKQRGEYDGEDDEDYNDEETAADDELDMEDDYGGLTNKQARIIEYIKSNLPNQIDFKGRIIFISNLSQEEFAERGNGSGAAILSRAFRTNLSFTSGEMLTFIESIVTKIDFPALSDAEKIETLAYLRQRYSIGAVKDDINFRVVIACFEYRVMGKEGGNWKRQIDQL